MPTAPTPWQHAEEVQGLLWLVLALKAAAKLVQPPPCSLALFGRAMPPFP